MSGAYTGPGTDEASQYIRTIHPALAERVSRFEENVAADGLQLSPEQSGKPNGVAVGRYAIHDPRSPMTRPCGDTPSDVCAAQSPGATGA